jgi:hypothetical protein
MADYFNTDWITDLHVADIAERETITTQLALLDNEIVAVCIAKGVLEADIPIDSETGYITSPTLINYAIYWIYVKLLSDYWGGAMGDTADIYKSKLDWYIIEKDRAKADLTYENILNANLTQSSYIRMVPVY